MFGNYEAHNIKQLRSICRTLQIVYRNENTKAELNALIDSALE